MWLRFVLLTLTVVSCAAVPRASGKRELQRLVRLPRLESPVPLAFDRNEGFLIFPNENAAAAEASDLLSEAKGVPKDAPLFLKAAQLHLSGNNFPEAIRSFSRAAELYNRQAESAPSTVEPLVGFSDACLGLGRFSEAQAALDKAVLLAPGDIRTDLGWARLHRDKAWFTFVGEENRFSSSSFLEIVRAAIRRGPSTRIGAAASELDAARRLFDRHAEASATRAVLLEQRAAFRSFAAALEKAFELVKARDLAAMNLPLSLFPRAALDDLARAAELTPANFRLQTVVAFTEVGQQLLTDPSERNSWSDLRVETRGRVLALCRELQRLAVEGSKKAAEAQELLGCTQLFALGDFSGAERSFRAALQAEPSRARSWDLLAHATARSGDRARSVEICEERSLALPNARSSAMLIRSYEDHGDPIHAEWSALVASAIYPNDFHVNLCLAALLLRREDFDSVSARVGDSLNIASKQLNGTSPLQYHLDFVALKAIYLGLSERAGEARALLQPYVSARPGSELHEILRALEFED